MSLSDPIFLVCVTCTQSQSRHVQSLGTHAACMQHACRHVMSSRTMSYQYCEPLAVVPEVGGTSLVVVTLAARTTIKSPGTLRSEAH